MSLSLSIEDDEARDSLAELHEWLRQEPEFRGKIAMVPSAARPGELGSFADVLSIAVGGGGALTVLTASLKAFFAQPRRSDVVLTISGQDGRSVQIDAKRIKDADALVATALGHFE